MDTRTAPTALPASVEPATRSTDETDAQQATPEHWVAIRPLRGTLDALDPTKLHAVAGYPDIVIAVVSDLRLFVVVDRACPHKQLDLAVFGNTNTRTAIVTCLHRDRCWTLPDGSPSPDTPPMATIPSTIINGELFVQIPGSVN